MAVPPEKQATAREDVLIEKEATKNHSSDIDSTKKQVRPFLFFPGHQWLLIWLADK